ncbi:MAG: hypothetical protein HDR11_13695 [Lachnospiraceae bacterium]|nr:hypothetical protein [Lachnospiraceae bacterium]
MMEKIQKLAVFRLLEGLFGSLEGIGLDVALLLIMWILVSMVIYAVDLYRLIKRRTDGETIALFLFPGFVAMGAAMYLGVHQGIPTEQKQKEITALFTSAELPLELLCLIVLFVSLWYAACCLRKRQREAAEESRLWKYSYIPDFAIATVIVCLSLYSPFVGNPFEALGEVSDRIGFRVNFFLCAFLYALSMLLFKMLLLLLAIITLAVSHKITCFPYRKGRRKASYFIRYLLFYQNAQLRGVLLFWIPMLAVLAKLCRKNSDMDAWLFAMVLGIFGVIVFVTAAVLPTVETWKRFGFLGARERMIEMFLSEYFLEQPIIKGKDFTVTRHFLIDENCPCAIYYWGMMTGISGWRFSGDIWSRDILFGDGSVCAVFRGDERAEEIFQYAGQFMGNDKAKVGAKQKVKLPKMGSIQGERRRILDRQMKYMFVVVFLLLLVLLTAFAAGLMD